MLVGRALLVQYRRFRNTDPPRLLAAWNDIFVQRGAAALPSTIYLEHFVYSKANFDAAGLIVAMDNDVCVGFVHVGMAPATPDSTTGVVCALGVRPAFRKQGIATELLRLAEEHLRSCGAVQLLAGGCWPDNPFYLGLYGGCDSPGFLRSDHLAEAFLLKRGYQIRKRVRVMQRDLAVPLTLFDPRFAALRNQHDMHYGSPKTLLGWWQECTFGTLDPLQYVLVDKQTGDWTARALLWEMTPYLNRWKKHAVGLFDFEVNTVRRRKGIGKYFLSSILREMQQNGIQLAEMQVEETNQPGHDFLRRLGFSAVDIGHVYVKA
jgi:ribosomal protein S18 acetylase RimI-like enzyme